LLDADVVVIPVVCFFFSWELGTQTGATTTDLVQHHHILVISYKNSRKTIPRFGN